MDLQWNPNAAEQMTLEWSEICEHAYPTFAAQTMGRLWMVSASAIGSDGGLTLAEPSCGELTKAVQAALR
jgi:hypothetical protein